MADLPAEDKIYNLGEKGCNIKIDGDVQDYTKLLKEYLEKNELFEDPLFPANGTSIFGGGTEKQNYVWKRPKEIVQKPEFCVDGFSRFDVTQGHLGDCWLTAPLTNLTSNKDLFDRVVPEQSFSENYAGIFHYRFWQHAKWIDVVVDDRLPTLNGKLVYLKSSQKNEFWSPLLEKAYAKLNGCYKALEGGSPGEAMTDLTGGVTETFDIRQNLPPKLFEMLNKAHGSNALMSCAIMPSVDVKEHILPNGLVKGHIYSITCVKKIKVGSSTEEVSLLRIRNPWGNKQEWKGAWADGSAEWENISDDQKRELGLVFAADGEFWMSFDDFNLNFHIIQITALNPVYQGGREGKSWYYALQQGSWVKGASAGGHDKCKTYCFNPQFRLVLYNTSTIIVELMQKNKRMFRKEGASNIPIAFAIYLIDNSGGWSTPLECDFFDQVKPLEKSGPYTVVRQVNSRFNLKLGTYCIVPSTYAPNGEGEFLLRVFSEHQIEMSHNDVDSYCSMAQFIPAYGHKRPISDIGTPNLLYRTFQILSGHRGQLKWQELKEILDYKFKDDNISFSKDNCRTLIACMDYDNSGRLQFAEFQNLVNIIRQTTKTFNDSDKNKSGTIDGFELTKALESMGLGVSIKIRSLLLKRYGNTKGEIEFDDFLILVVKLVTIFDVFKNYAGEETQRATFSLDEWLYSTLYM